MDHRLKFMEIVFVFFVIYGSYLVSGDREIGNWSVDKVGSLISSFTRSHQDMCDSRKYFMMQNITRKQSETANKIFHDAAQVVTIKNKRLRPTHKNKKKVSHPIEVFWHMSSVEKDRIDFIQIVTRQHDLLHSSGLWKAAFKIHIGIVGKAQLPTSISKDITISSHVKIFAQVSSGDESLTTTYMRELCRLRRWSNQEQHYDGMVLYFHSKSLFHHFEQPTQKWIYAMEYFIIKKWKAASSIIISGADTAGCAKAVYDCVPHYSGNFFWSSVDYIASLPDPNSNVDGFEHKYTSGEFWLLAQDPQPEKSIHFALHNPSESLSTKWSEESDYQHYDLNYIFKYYSCMDAEEPNMPSRVRCV